MKTAWIAGASGLVGRELLHLLLEHPAYATIVALVRRPLAMSHPRLTQVTVDFDRLEQQTGLPQPDDVFCCLGTTIKKAGSQAAFRQVDHDYPLALARLGHRAGARRYLLVSSMGAAPKSMFFYNRVKGEVEASVSAVGIPAVAIFRPSLLLGNRGEYRFGESAATVVMKLLHPLMAGPMRKYRAIPAERVAGAMLHVAQHTAAGAAVYENDRIEDLEG